MQAFRWFAFALGLAGLIAAVPGFLSATGSAPLLLAASGMCMMRAGMSNTEQGISGITGLVSDLFLFLATGMLAIHVWIPFHAEQAAGLFLLLAGLLNLAAWGMRRPAASTQNAGSC